MYRKTWSDVCLLFVADAVVATFRFARSENTLKFTSLSLFLYDWYFLCGCVCSRLELVDWLIWWLPLVRYVHAISPCCCCRCCYCCRLLLNFRHKNLFHQSGKQYYRCNGIRFDIFPISTWVYCYICSWRSRRYEELCMYIASLILSLTRSL